MKWYTGISSYSKAEHFDMLEIAIISCIKNTFLKPNVITDKISDRLELLQHKYNVLVTTAPTESLFYEFCNYKPEYKGTAGAYLRTCIPLIEQDPYILYTDIDILFGDLKTKKRELSGPEYFSAAPEFNMNDWSYFNSGCMLMNTASLRQDYQMLWDFVKNNFDNISKNAHDQAAYNFLYKNKWNKLPVEFNWKPHWGLNTNFAVLHFHGPKPEHIQAYFDGQLKHLFGPDVEGYNIYNKMISSNTESYRYYLNLYNDYKNYI